MNGTFSKKIETFFKNYVTFQLYRIFINVDGTK